MTRTHARFRAAFACVPLVFGALLVLNSPAAEASNGNARNAVAGTSAAPATAPPRSVRFLKAPSAETPAARAKRLKRECKGRPNAGMCLGHAR